jgi:dTMP kinase
MLDEFLSGQSTLNPTAQFLAFTADIAKDQNRIFKELSSGKMVILDRYIFSTIAYQNLPFERATEAVKVLKFLKPDMVFFLDVSPELAMGRIKKHAKLNKYETDKEKMLAAKIKYRIMADQNFLGDWKVIDGTKKMSDISKAICANLKL